MISIARYAHANATLHALLPDILPMGVVEALLAARSPDEAWRVLEKTEYAEWLPASAHPDLFEMEDALHNATGYRFSKIPAGLTGTPRKVGRLLLARWDLDALLKVLRLWHGREIPPPSSPSLHWFVKPIPELDKIRQASSLMEIGSLLKETPYALPLLGAMEPYTRSHSLFPVEIALEKDYYRRLLSACHAQGGNDARESARWIGGEIDLLNLTGLARLSQYHALPEESLSEYLIPGPSELTRQLGRHGLTDTLWNTGLARYRPQGEQEVHTLSRPEEIQLLERALLEQQRRQAQKALLGFPFGIAPILAFYVLTRLALRNMRTVLAAQACGMEPGLTRLRLCLGG